MNNDYESSNLAGLSHIFTSKDEEDIMVAFMQHNHVMRDLHHFLQTTLPVCLLCGDSGVGKSILIRNFVAQLPPEIVAAHVVSPEIGFHGIADFICRQIGDISAAASDKKFAAACRRFSEEKGGKVVIIIDSADMIEDKELLYLLLAAEAALGDNTALQIIICGDIYLSERLTRMGMDPRYAQNTRISNLSELETREYIITKLEVSGCENSENIFDNEAMRLIHHFTAGNPAHINQIVQIALTMAGEKSLSKISSDIIKLAYQKSEKPKNIVPMRANNNKYVPLSRKNLERKSIFVSILFALAIGAIYFMNNKGDNLPDDLNMQMLSEIPDEKAPVLIESKSEKEANSKVEIPKVEIRQGFEMIDSTINTPLANENEKILEENKPQPLFKPMPENLLFDQVRG